LHRLNLLSMHSVRPWSCRIRAGHFFRRAAHTNHLRRCRGGSIVDQLSNLCGRLPSVGISGTPGIPALESSRVAGRMFDAETHHRRQVTRNRTSDLIGRSRNGKEKLKNNGAFILIHMPSPAESCAAIVENRQFSAVPRLSPRNPRNPRKLRRPQAAPYWSNSGGGGLIRSDGAAGEFSGTTGDLFG